MRTTFAGAVPLAALALLAATPPHTVAATDSITRPGSRLQPPLDSE
jgi:hypothetical protein